MNRAVPRVLWGFRGVTVSSCDARASTFRLDLRLLAWSEGYRPAPTTLEISPERSWSWGESNPRPPSGHRPRYDHSRDCGSTVTALPGQLSLRSPPDLSPVPAVFPAVSGLSRRHPLLLLPGCSGQAPRALASRDDSQLPEIRRRERSRSWRFLLLPRFRSLSNSGRTSGSRSRGRNRSAPCCRGASVPSRP